MVVASVLKRTIIPALSWLSPQTAGVTLPSAASGRRWNQRLRGSSFQARPSTPHSVTLYQSSFGGGAGVAFGGAAGAAAGAAGACAREATGVSVQTRTAAREAKTREGRVIGC